MDKRHLFFWSVFISRWAGLATWLHLEAPPENTEKINKYQLSNIELVLTHIVLKLGVLSIAEKLSQPSVNFMQKKIQNFQFYGLGAAQNPIDHNVVDRNFKD